MTRWIAIGAVVGFGIAVLVVSVLRPDAPPPPAATAPAPTPPPAAAVPLEVPKAADRHLGASRVPLVLELDPRRGATVPVPADAGP